MTNLTVDLHEEWEAEDEHSYEFEERLDLDVEAERTRTAWFGLVVLALGALWLLIACIVFLIGYPDAWYALDRSLDASRRHIRLVMSLFGAGTVALFLGASLYFFGRRIRGEATVDAIRLEAAS